MIVPLSSLFIVTSIISTTYSCDKALISNGQLEGYKAGTKSGDSAVVSCKSGYATYTGRVTCTDDGTWLPAPECHQVAVKFSSTSLVKYVFPIPYDSVDSTISFAFSTHPSKSSGVLLRLVSKLLADGSRDTMTIEIIGGYIATTMELSSGGQSVVGFCHDNVALDDNNLHRVVLKRDMASLTMFIDNRPIQCSPTAGNLGLFKFSSLRIILVGHFQLSWGPDFGFAGCMTDLVVDGLAPLVLADLEMNAGTDLPVTMTDISFVSDCGPDYIIPPLTTEQPVSTLNTSVVTGGAVAPGDKEDDKTTLIIILVVIILLIILVIIIGIICKRYYNNKGTYKIDESRLGEEEEPPEQEYFI